MEITMKITTKRITNEGVLKGFEVLATFSKEERRIAHADCNVTNVKHRKCGGRIHKLFECKWGQWYVCEKCCADMSTKLNLKHNK